MIAVTHGSAIADRARPTWGGFIRQELAPAPGRFSGAVRMIVGTTIVLITSMTLEVPIVALSLFIVLFLTKVTSNVTTQNSVAITITGVLAIIVATIAIALTLLILDATIDQPPLRLGAMALVFFLGMFVSRVFKVGQAGYLIALIVLVSQAYIDPFPGPESIVRVVLWIWVAVVYPAAVAIGVNLLLLPADPEPLLRREVASRLRAVARALVARRGSVEAADAAQTLADFAARGPTPLLTLMRLAEIRDPKVAPRHAERAAKIQMLMRLIDSAALVAGVSADRSPAEQARLAHLAAECERYAEAVASENGGVSPLLAPTHRGVGGARSPVTPIIDEIERVIRELPVVERPVADELERGGLFAPDTLRNPAYAQFALKVTLAAMLCYVFYTAVDWNGIHTSMTTCAIVALGSAGATIHKATLRLVGCAIGGLLALGAIVFLIPKMTSIVSLALLVAAVTAPAAWIAMGSERTAYLGVQLAFTFYLATLQGFGPSADVTEFRDRFVGVVVGVVVMSLVFAFVWPERAEIGARKSLAAALRRMARLAQGPDDFRAERAAAWQSLDEADRLRRLSELEPAAVTAEGIEEGRRVRSLSELAGAALIALGVLAERRGNRRAAGTTGETNPAVAIFAMSIGSVLTGVADRVETDAGPRYVDLRVPRAALRRAPGGIDANDDVALSEIVADRVEALQRAAVAGA